MTATRRAGLSRGYLAAPNRENILHCRCAVWGDRGMTTTVADVRAIWTAPLDGRIVSPDSVDEFVRPHGDVADRRTYGLTLRAVDGAPRAP